MAVVAQPYTHTRTRSEAQPSADRSLNTLLLLAAMAALLALATLAQTGRVATRGYELTKLSQEQTALIRHADQVRLQIAQARSLDRVQQRATEALGMHVAPSAQLHYLTVEVDQLPIIAQRR